MTTTTTTTKTLTDLVKVTEGVMSGNVFYGSIKMNTGKKTLDVIVSNHLKENRQYEFRIASKCKAGFISMSDWKCTPREIIAGFKKNALVNVQVKHTYENGNETWLNVYTTKSGKWHSIDMGFLKVLTVGDMRSSHPDMCDSKVWESVGAKTWADKAFDSN